MIGFGIDEIQAEYVAEIKLRHLNREYILKRIKDIEQLENDIADLEATLASKNKMKKIIIGELDAVAEKYDSGRKSEVLYDADEELPAEVIEIADYPVTLFLSEQGYLKKIKTANLRMSGEQKVKEGDRMLPEIECSNKDELLFFTNNHQVYKSKADDFVDTKASVLGEYVPSKLDMDEGEQVVYMAVLSEYSGYMLFAFENGKLAKVDMSAYATKTNRKKLINAYSNKSPLAGAIYIKEDTDIVLSSSGGRKLLINTAGILPKTTKDTLGIAAMKLKKTHKVLSIHIHFENEFEKEWRFRAKNLPAAGALPGEADIAEQITF